MTDFYTEFIRAGSLTFMCAHATYHILSVCEDTASLTEDTREVISMAVARRFHELMRENMERELHLAMTPFEQQVEGDKDAYHSS